MIDVKRDEPAPLSLSKEQHYNQLDVLRALHKVFLGKCYLCETAVELGTFEVDHHKPKAEYSTEKFSWSNLFPTCNTHRCNNRRERSYPASGLLDPAGNEDVENRVSQQIQGDISITLREDSTTSRFSFAATSPADMAAVNTARELDRIHNGTGSSETARETSISLRDAIRRRVFDVAGRVRAFLQIDPHDVERRKTMESELRVLLSRRAPYTMLVRSYVTHRAEIRALFD